MVAETIDLEEGAIGRTGGWDGLEIMSKVSYVGNMV